VRAAWTGLPNTQRLEKFTAHAGAQPKKTPCRLPGPSTAAPEADRAATVPLSQAAWPERGIGGQVAGLSNRAGGWLGQFRPMYSKKYFRLKSAPSKSLAPFFRPETKSVCTWARGAGRAAASAFFPAPRAFRA
jgi:hypothetical protein